LTVFHNVLFGWFTKNTTNNYYFWYKKSHSDESNKKYKNLESVHKYPRNSGDCHSRKCSASGILLRSHRKDSGQAGM